MSALTVANWKTMSLAWAAQAAGAVLYIVLSTVKYEKHRTKHNIANSWLYTAKPPHATPTPHLIWYVHTFDILGKNKLNHLTRETFPTRVNSNSLKKYLQKQTFLLFQPLLWTKGRDLVFAQPQLPVLLKKGASASSMGSRANANLAFSYVAVLFYSSQAFHHIFFLIYPPHLPCPPPLTHPLCTTTLKNTSFFFSYSHPGVTDALHICLRVLQKTD